MSTAVHRSPNKIGDLNPYLAYVKDGFTFESVFVGGGGGIHRGPSLHLPGGITLLRLDPWLVGILRLDPGSLRLDFILD
jgi:hypothetical protein